MKKINKLSVYFDNGKEKLLTGTLALYKNRYAAFAYCDEWLKNGFSISPFSLPLEKKVFIPEWEPFGGIFGVFNDSLPDGWGRLLVDRMSLRHGANPDELSILDRLSIVGSNGMGTLTYEPAETLIEENTLKGDYDEICAECEKILNSPLNGDDIENLDGLFKAGGSSGGARPKIFAKIDGEDWIIKFPSSEDSKQIGLQEFEYNKCAKKCGLEISPYNLFPSKNCSGYFGTKRFDRTSNGEKIFMLSASALLETSHRIPNLDYNTLFLLTQKLTKNNQEAEKLFSLMCFNVFAHNRDDHSKNFSWIFDASKKQWHISPAYDLTYSSSLGGEHATTIDSEGKNPGLKEILNVAAKNGLKENFARQTAEKIKNQVTSDLFKWLK